MTNFSAVGLQTNAALNYTPIMSPTLNSYAGLSGEELVGLANAQAGYSPHIPSANLSQANEYVQAASNATDPNLREQLLEQAVAVLTRGGAPSAGSALASTGGSPVNQGTVMGMPSPTTSPAAGGLTESGNSVNTGEYTITASTKDDGSLTITNNQTGQSTEVWGDPHIKVNGQDVADFQKGPLNIQLQDGTVVHIDPTQLQNGVAHIGQVSITKGDQAVTMGGSGQNGFEGGVNTSSVENGVGSYQTALYNAPNATDITLGADGNLYYNNANGSMGSEITAKQGGGETDLDGAGGGLIGVPSAGGTAQAGGTSDPANTMTQLLGLLSGSQESFYGIMMQQTLQQMMSTSGYAQQG